MPKKVVDLFFLALSMESMLAEPIPSFSANAHVLPLDAIEVSGELIFEKSPPLLCSTDPPFP